MTRKKTVRKGDTETDAPRKKMVNNNNEWDKIKKEKPV